MTAPRISDHALLRFLEQAGGMDVAGLRASLAASLERSHAAAERMGGGDHMIVSGQMVFMVRAGTVVTVSQRRSPGADFRALKHAPE